MAEHALLSPSAAHRWLNCAAAPRLEAEAEDKGSIFAAEGTCAHAHCAIILKEYLGQDISDEALEVAALDKLYLTGEMSEYTETYATIVVEKFNAARATTKDAQLLIETRLDFSQYVPEAFGTADAIIIADGTMEVIDFKYGKGVKVSAYENAQMKIYALGAYLLFNFEYHIERVKMTIVQPRIDNLSEFEMTVADLLAWGENELKPKAAVAFSGKGEQKPGEWCQFCKVKHACKALTMQCVNAVKQHTDPMLVSKEDMETVVLPIIATVKTWLSGIEEYALNQALSGVSYAGYKVVEGRSIRKITNPDGAALALNRAGYKSAEIYKPQELCSIGDLEKLVGKKQFAALCGEFVTKPAGKPTLVPESDKRAAYNTADNDFKDIINQ